MNYFDVLLAKKLEDTRDPVVKGLSVAENGRYSEENTVYDVVVVDVPETRLTTLNATANGTYTPQEGEAYNEVNVDVPLPSNAYLLKSLTGLPQDIATFTDGADAPLNALTASIDSSCAGADIIVSESEIINNKTPYIYRRSAGGDRVYEKLIGGTIAWNQGVKNGNFADTSDWFAVASTKAVSNNEMTITVANQTTGQGIASESAVSTSWGVGHKVLATFDVKTNATNAKIRGTLAYNTATKNRFLKSDTLITATWQRLSGIVNISEATSGIRIIVVDPSIVQVGETITFRNVMAFDLTQMFGSTIADYIYSLEQTTAGAGVAYFRQMFPNDYYAYDSGTLQSVNVAGKKVYDSNNTLVATYTFDSDLTLRGIPKLDANNNLYYDGDTYESDGNVTRRYGIVDLGSLTWTYASSNTRFYSTDISTLAKKPSDNNSAINGVAAFYMVGSVSDLNYNDKILAIDSSGNLFIKDTAYTDATTFKTAMSGVYLVYELATPTTESADPYINPQIVDADGTEEFVDYAYSQSTRDVAVPVGHDSYYYDGTLYSRDFPATISSGSYDIINGVITSGQNTYNTTPLPLRSLVGNNNIYVDCGEITNLEYFTKEQHE